VFGVRCLTISLQPLGLSLLGSPILSSLGFGAFLTLYLCYLREVAISIRSGFSIWKVRCVQLKGIRVGRDKGWYAGLSAYGTSPLTCSSPCAQTHRCLGTESIKCHAPARTNVLLLCPAPLTGPWEALASDLQATPSGGRPQRL
jgi:hypothetical protein